MKQILGWEGDQSPLLPAALQASSQDTQAPGPHTVSDPQGGGGTGQPQETACQGKEPRITANLPSPPEPSSNLLQSWSTPPQ